MPKAMIDIGQFRAHSRERTREENLPLAVRFATVTAPVAASESRTFSFVFSDESVDRYGDVIFARGWVLENFNANPIALFGHDAGSVENVIGRAKNVRVEGARLIGDIEFMEAAVNPNAEAVYQMVKGGFLKTVSVGFQPIEWALSKDKSRPQGVDFKKQELLEISVVPIPANPDALVQARAAGIDVDRLGLIAAPATTRVAPKLTKKGLYSVSYLASILADLGYLQESVAWEAEYEGDGSAVPQQLLDAMKALGAALVAMTAEEVAELLAGKDDEADVVALGGNVGIRRHAFALLRRLDDGALAGLSTVMADLAAGRCVLVKTVEAAAFAPLVRAGKTISSANEKKLRDAHCQIVAAAECIRGVFEPDDPEDDDPDSEDKAAIAARRAAAEARKRALA